MTGLEAFTGSQRSKPLNSSNHLATNVLKFGEAECCAAHRTVHGHGVTSLPLGALICGHAGALPKQT